MCTPSRLWAARGIHMSSNSVCKASLEPLRSAFQFVAEYDRGLDVDPRRLVCLLSRWWKVVLCVAALARRHWRGYNRASLFFPFLCISVCDMCGGTGTILFRSSEEQATTSRDIAVDSGPGVGIHNLNTPDTALRVQRGPS